MSKPIRFDPASFREATFHTWHSPLRQGLPPTTSSFVPSGENRTVSIRSEMPTSRATRVEPSAFQSSASWKPDTASSLPSGEKSNDVIWGPRE